MAMEKKKNKRKKKLIRPKNQMQSALVVLGISIISFVLVCGIIFYVTEYLSQKISADIVRLNDSVEIQHNIIKAVEKFAKSVSSEIYDVSVFKVVKDSDKSFDYINDHVTQLSLFLKYYGYIFIALIIVQIIFGILLFRYMVSLTHRMYGPEKVLSYMIKKIASNEPFTPRPLRKNDMLQDLYNDILKCAKKKKLLKPDKNAKS